MSAGLLPFLVVFRGLRLLRRLLGGAFGYVGPPLPRWRANVPARVMAAATISLAAVDWLSDNTIHPELAQRRVAPAVADLLRGEGVFGLAVAALIGVVFLSGTWIGDNVLLPAVGLLVAALQIELTAGPGWLGVAVVLTVVILGVLWMLGLRISFVLKFVVLVGLALVAGLLLVPPTVG